MAGQKKETRESAGDIIKELSLESIRMLYVDADQQELYKRVMDIAMGRLMTVSPSESLKAIELIWNRMYGLPKATTDLKVENNSVDLSKLSDEQLANLATILASAQPSESGETETA